MLFEQLLTEKFSLVRELAKLGISARTNGNEDQQKSVEDLLGEYFEIKEMYVKDTNKKFRRFLAMFWEEDVIEFLSKFKV